MRYLHNRLHYWGARGVFDAIRETILPFHHREIFVCLMVYAIQDNVRAQTLALRKICRRKFNQFVSQNAV